jgi:hypothetical protein
VGPRRAGLIHKRRNQGVSPVSSQVPCQRPKTGNGCPLSTTRRLGCHPTSRFLRPPYSLEVRKPIYRPNWKPAAHLISGALSERPQIGVIMFCPANLVKLAWNRASVKRERIRAGLPRTVGCRSLRQMIRDQLQTGRSEAVIRDLHSSA